VTDETTLTALRHRLAEVCDSMSDVHMTIPDSAIFANASKRRTRRGIAAAMTAVCAAIGLAVAFGLPGGQGRGVHVHLAAWSVDTNSNGTVTVTIRQMLGNPAGLQQALARDGVPALVRYIPYRTSTRHRNGHTDTATYPACEYQGRLPKEPGSITTRAISGASTTPPHLAFVIHTSAMPKGSVVYIETGFAWTATLLTSPRLPRCVPAGPPPGW
jgi:hypothetical protein